jgi:ATP-dependent Clp protease ATP-binding subunit ClpC
MHKSVNDGVNAAVVKAHYLAKSLHHPQVLPAHLLSALLLSGESALSRMAPNLNADLVMGFLTDHVDPSFTEGEGPLATATIQILRNIVASADSSGLRATEVALLNEITNSRDDVSLQLMDSDFVKGTIVVPTPTEPSMSSQGNARRMRKDEEFVAPGLTIPKSIASFVTDMRSNTNVNRAPGREDTLERMMTVLSRRTKANPVLVGEAGVGKSAIAEEFAALLEQGEVPHHLLETRLWNVDVGSMMAGTRSRGDLEERAKKLINAASQENIVLFIDEIHSLVGAGASGDSSMSVANLFKPALSRGDFKLIGATTWDEYRKYIANDEALERRFSPVEVSEPDEALALVMLNSQLPALSEHHHVTFTPDSVRTAIKLTKEWVPDRFLPDKALDVLDEAGSRLALKRARVGSASDFNSDDQVCDVVSHETVTEIVSLMTGIALTSLDPTGTADLLNLANTLSQRVIGQDHAVSVVSRALARRRVGVSDTKRPVSMLFAGPTGVGKTELAKALSAAVVGKDDAAGLIIIDCSELDSPASLSKLTGAPPGYVGHEDGSDLVSRVRRNRKAVVVFDEVDKADPGMFDVLLQVLEEGRLTDSAGVVADFSATTVILTTNSGAARLAANPTGFSSELETSRESVVRSELSKTFRPEFLNRLDEIVVFNTLTPGDAAHIAMLEVSRVVGLAADAGVTLSVDEDVYDVLASEGFDRVYGARSLRRHVSLKLTDELADFILMGEKVVRVATRDGEILVTAVRAEVLV